MATFQNQATLSYANNVVNSNVVTGELLTVLSATKLAARDTYSPDGEVSYILTLKNTGATDITGVTVTDNLGAYQIDNVSYVPLTYVNDSVIVIEDGTRVASPTVTAGDTLSISGITVPANGVAFVYYTAKTNSLASPQTGASITNTAVISSSLITDAVTVNATVNANTAADLSITKSLSPLTVTENGEVTYTFTIQNIGNTAAAVSDNVSVSDTFSPVLKNISVLLNDTALTEASGYTYNETTGVFTTAPGAITVPAATFTQDTTTKAWTVTPGTATLTVTGTI